MQTMMACIPLTLLVAGGYLAFRYHRQLRSSLSGAYKQVPAEDPYGTFAHAGQGDGKRGKGKGGKLNTASLQGDTPRLTPAPTPRVLERLQLSASIDSLVSAKSGSAPSVDSLPTIVGGVVGEREQQRRATEVMGERAEEEEEEEEETRDREEERRLEQLRPVVKEDFSFDIPSDGGATATESAAAGSVAAPAFFDSDELPDLVIEAVTDDLPVI